MSSVAVAVTMLVGACGSSSNSSSSTSVSSPSSTTAGSSATGSTIQLGDIADETGACVPSPEPEQGQTLSAWQNYVNAHGGIAGHPVKVTTIDTQCNPADAASAAQTLLSDHVLAIIDGTSLDSAWQKTVDAAKVPVLCGIQSGDGFTCEADANFFPAGTTVLAGVYGQLDSAKLAGSNDFGYVYCSEVAACKQAIPLDQNFAKQLGLNFPTPLAASFTQASYTAQCLELMQSHVKAVFPTVPLTKFADDCAQQGYHPIYIQSEGTWQASYLKDPNLNGTTGLVSFLPWSYQGPQTTVFHEVEDGVLSGTNIPYNVSATYTTAQLFATALAGAGPNPTTTDVYNGLYAMHNETLGGLAPPLNFTPNKPTQVNCFFVLSIKNGAYVSPYGAATTCEPSA